MLVTFKTKAYSDITMFGDVAISLLHLMGHSGTIPGAINAEDVPYALERLQAAVSKERKTPADEEAVSLATRALPLIELLAAAKKRNCFVSWDKP